MNWLGEAKLLQGESVRCEVKLRSTHQGSAATIHYEPSIDRAIVKLDQAHKAITKGQACALYSGNRLLGGGWISNVYEQ